MFIGSMYGLCSYTVLWDPCHLLLTPPFTSLFASSVPSERTTLGKRPSGLGSTEHLSVKAKFFQTFWHSGTCGYLQKITFS